MSSEQQIGRRRESLRKPATGSTASPDSPPRRTRVRRALRYVAVAALVLLVVPGVSIARTLTAPGTDSTSARLAEWARDHRLGSAVTWMEKRSYRPPKVGGAPAADSPLGGQHAAAVAAGTRPGPVATALPRPVRPLARPPVAGEGSWRVLAGVAGQPALAAAYLRPDAIHTSYVAGLVWINPRLVRGELHPGRLDPGGRGWAEPSSLAGRRAGLLAAFNSGFRLASAHGGFYLAGRHAGRLRPGAASLVFRRDGSLTVAKWGRDARLDSSVTAVRQNLSMLVDGGRINPGVDTDAGVWGATLGAAKYVWRSGIGVRRDGTLVYAASNRLTARSLAELLVRGGCVRAMELDINPAWTSFVRYTPAPANVLPDMQGSPRRYDTSSSRDFIALYARDAAR